MGQSLDKFEKYEKKLIKKFSKKSKKNNHMEINEFAKLLGELNIKYHLKIHEDKLKNMIDYISRVFKKYTQKDL